MTPRVRVVALAAAAALALAAAPPPLVHRDVMIPDLVAGRRALAAGDFPTASAAIRRALARVPDDPGLLFNLAQVEVRAGHPDEALRLLDSLSRRATGFDPVVDPRFLALADRPGYAAMMERFDLGAPQVMRSAEVAYIDDANLFPEGIAADPRDGTLYVGSIRERKIVRVGRDGRVTDFTRARQDSLLGVLGLRVDDRRRLLWAVAAGGPEVEERERGRSGLWAFELGSGKLVRRWMSPPGQEATFNDLTLDARGRVYVTDTDSGALFSTSGPDGALEVFLAAGQLRAPNGIDVAPDGQRLYVASSGRGITAVDLASKQTTGLAVPRDVVALGIDGLYAQGRTLIAVQNLIGRPRVVRYTLRSPLEIDGLEILESRHALYDLPTTGTIWKGGFYYVANPHLDHLDASGAVAPSDSLTRLVILRLPLGGEH